MGQVLWIMDADAAPDTLADDLWALSHFSTQLDRICRDRGLKKLSEFHDLSAEAAEFDVEIDRVTCPPSELLATLSPLLEAVKEGEGKFQKGGQDRRADVEAELENAIRIARELQEANRQVRVTVVS